MPKLTRAQQAAAATFGHFPAADAIGRDDPRIAAYAANARTAPVASVVGDQRLVPTGAPLGSAAKSSPPPARTVAAQAKPAPPPAEPPRASSTAATGFDLGDVSNGKTGAIEVAQVAGGELAPSQPQSPAAAPELPIEPPSLDQAFAEFEKVATSAGPAPGAVDVRAIKPQREAAPPKPEPTKPAKPAKPKDPSRVWVQVATGGNRKALATDWKRITRKATKEFRGKSGYLVDWGRTNRLVTGPFASEDKAQDFVTDLKKAGLNTFMFTSDEGEKVVPLGGK
jgi:hypothetical protein